MSIRQQQTRKVAKSAPPAPADGGDDALSHNLLGQRLGRKGRDTRERILAATDRLLADPQGIPLSLSAVAREASLAMTTLYLYFSDLTELLLAVLDPIMGSAEDAYVAQLRRHWPDETLGDECLAFVTAFHAFWDRHTRILHLRNSYAAGLDPRMVRQRVASSSPLIALLVVQMDGDPAEAGSLKLAIATALLTGTERLVTIATDTDLASAMDDEVVPNVPNLLRGQARLLELGIRDCRAMRG
jgi:AcrR family transcriptional regulator